MKTINVNKAALVSLVSKSKASHIRELLKARTNWKKDAAKQLKAATTRVGSFDPHTGRFKGSRVTDPYSMLIIDIAPKDMTDEYDRVLRMLKLETRTEVTLDENEYRQYVENDWNWRREWTTSNSKYL